ncbi:hypothetical protein C0989_000367, partial [Termitomyces sp. Mn162]
APNSQRQWAWANTSPIKRQDKRKTATYVQFLGQKQEISRLKAKLEVLKKQAEGIIDPSPSPSPPVDDQIMTSELSANDSDATVAFDELPSPECVTTQDEEYFQKFSVDWCSCEELPYVLVANGLFPTAPLFPRFAISVHLLDFYHALFERLCDAVNAMAHALNTFYVQRGFIVTDNKGIPVQDAFHRGLGYAAQCKMMNLSRPTPSHAALPSLPSDPPALLPSLTSPKSQIKLVPGECARILRQRCPCCFGGNLFGQSLECNGSNVKTNWDKFDDGGLMALVCRNDIPIFLANIDIPGEQQKYAVAMIEYLFSLLPLSATVSVLYDVGCVLDRSLRTHSHWLYIVDCKVNSIGLELHNDLEAPVRLKKELDTVLTLQSDLKTCKKNLQAMCLTLSKALPSPHALQILSSLQDHHEQLKDDVEELYSFLSIQDSYPELQGVDLEFVKYFLIACDLKINVQKWAVGTKLHQATHAAIKKHAPTLMAGLQKYNDICATLSAMYKPEWKIPLPEPLPTELKPLHDVSHLMQDVWINCPTEEVPQWLSDSTVQEGIWAMLKTEWCTEELQQLHVEAINLSLWFSCELAAVELALIKPSSMCYIYVAK